MTEQEIIKRFADSELIDTSHPLIAKWMQEDNYEDSFFEPYKCYCSCEECREWERKTGEKPECEYYTEED